MTGLYIHVPFCNYKCLYCDFYSAGVRIAEWSQYIEALLNELSQRKQELPSKPVTLYIGGGTPSLMPPDFLHHLVNSIRRILKKNEAWREFTLEANPEDVSEENCKIWKSIGVNRLSIGIQSLSDVELKTIGRRHSSKKAIEAINIARKYFNNISADVIFGLPGQIPESYEKTLRQLINLSVDHLSAYSLMLEEGTVMTFLHKKGNLVLPQEEEWMRMFEMTVTILKNAGFSHYEISNYAKPGKKSIHNSSYWKGIPYLGIGPGAHSYDGKMTRRANPTDLKGYLAHYLAHKNNGANNFESGLIKNIANFYEEENLTDEELREEMIMTRLRMQEGLDLSEFEQRFGFSYKEDLLKTAVSFINRQELQLQVNSSRLHLSITEKGLPLSDFIISSLI